MGRKSGLWPVITGFLSYVEEEKVDAREFEEDQVAGRLKEDVVRVVGGWWEEGVGLARPWNLTLLFPAAGAEGQAAEVSSKGGE